MRQRVCVAWCGGGCGVCVCVVVVVGVVVVVVCVVCVLWLVASLRVCMVHRAGGL